MAPSKNPIQRLNELGQSIWYDYIRRDLLGEPLETLIEQGLCGMTSNPTIFEKAIAHTDLYDEEIRRAGASASPEALLEDLMVSDICRAADIFRPVYDSTAGNDGFVSIEVDPRLAHDTGASIASAERLFERCGRPNVMVKIPGTLEGLAAVRQCLESGININITLLFSTERYERVIDAFMDALEARLKRGEAIDTIRSVASFFVSRVDTNTDRRLDAIAEDASRSDEDRRLAKTLRGKIAIANAKQAYSIFERAFCGGARFSKLFEAGARAQRPLWASTSTKDKAYPELYYVDGLVAPGSVNTLPEKTFASYLDDGQPKVRIYDELPAAREDLQRLSALGVDVGQIAEELEADGVDKFAASFEAALAAVAKKQSMLLGGEAPSPSPPG